MERTTIDVGIDLGTTNSTIAVIDGIDARVIPNKAGSTVTASAVWIDRGKVRVGEEAKGRAMVDDRDNAQAEFKLLMGRGDEARKLFVKSGRSLLPEELSAEVLKSLKLDFQSNTGEDLPSAVITVPAAFENPQTAATRRAAELAGLTNSPLLLEPVAASLAYGFQTESENVYWLVYDFGGGTFDAAVMRIRDGLIQVVNHDGDNDLGGKRIDWDLVTRKIAPALIEQYDLPDFDRGNPQWDGALHKLKWLAEKAKIEVCRTQAPAEVYHEALCTDASGKVVELVYELTPADVEEVGRPHVETSLHLCRKTLDDCGLTGADMERILMVGGSTLNPFVRDAVQSELEGNIEYGIDPVTVVARGAAIFAATQPRIDTGPKKVDGVWNIDIVHQPVGNVPDPDIGGKVEGPSGENPEGYTIEFVDTKTQWRSGRVTMGAEGVFMMQLYAEKQRRNEYHIELSDPTGTRVSVNPATVSYTVGVIPEPNPPAARSIVVGLADSSVAGYVKKGTRLPSRKTLDHVTGVALRAGVEEDALNIPLLEGEHGRAVRNHNVGVMTIRGSDVRRDLPIGSHIEITVAMDVSQQLKMNVFVPMLDQDFDLDFEATGGHAPLDELRRDVSEQRDRLAEIRRKATQTGTTRVETVVARIVNQQLLEHVDDLLARAAQDGEAVFELDRRVRELAAVIDEAEDSVELPEVVKEARKSLDDAREVVAAYGQLDDRNRLTVLTESLMEAIDLEDADLLRRLTMELDTLYFAVLDPVPGYHLAEFERRANRVGEMSDPAQGERLVAQGRRAIANGDMDYLKATNRQLLSLLPRAAQQEVRHRNIGDTLAKG